MFSEKLQEMKKNVKYTSDYLDLKELESFCKREDIIGNTIENIYVCWKEYCTKKNIKLCSPNVLGRSLKNHFHLKSKKIRISKDKTTMFYYE